MIFKTSIYPIDGYKKQMTTADNKVIDLYYLNIRDDDAFASKFAEIRVDKIVYDQIAPNGYGKEYSVIGRWDWKRTDFATMPHKIVIKEIIPEVKKSKNDTNN